MANKTKEEIKEVNNAKVKFSNRTILFIVVGVLALILIGVYIYRWQQIKTDELYLESYLLKSDTVSLEIKNLDEVGQILTESPNEYFVLITYTGDEKTYELEKGIKTIIDDYKLADSFYYLNVESIMQEDNYLARINNAFKTEEITKVPIILYYKDGKIIDTVERKDNNCINAGDFQKLLDIYKYEGR